MIVIKVTNYQFTYTKNPKRIARIFVPFSLFPTPYSLFPDPLFPVPFGLA
ncbi:MULTISPECIES: hypothetical protein [unclassified Moorena]|nr:MULTISPECIES: hypothetical protein [unclassified Moorena]NEO23006.1 hypothetical protein [Moorena sp. SIO4A5]NEQ61950.1 hypothetical protein [Moorena sp. SIO4A1]